MAMEHYAKLLDVLNAHLGAGWITVDEYGGVARWLRNEHLIDLKRLAAEKQAKP